MLKIIGVSLIGLAHKKEGEKLQDFFNIYVSNLYASIDSLISDEAIARGFEGDGIALVFVADGAGSVKYGGDGAKYAVNSAIEFVKNKNLINEASDEVLKGILKAALESVRHGASVLNASIEDLSTTFMALYVKDHECSLASIGDGYVIIDDGSELKLLNVPIKGEYFNETQFITSPEIVKAIEDGSIEVRRSRCNAFAVTTDGLWPTVINGKPYEKFYRPIIDYLRGNDTSKVIDELLNLLKSIQGKYPSAYDDDLTIVVGAYE